MNEALLMLHFFGFGAGVAASAGNGAIGGLIAQSPGDAPVLSKVQPIFARLGQIGLAFLWLTGVILVWTKWGGPQNLPWAFWVKFACVALLTALIVYMTMLGNRARAGDPTARKQMATFGPFGGVLLGLVVIFAVIAFN